MLGYVAALASLLLGTLCILVYRQGRHATNRALSLLLFFDSLSLISFSLIYLTNRPAIGHAGSIVSGVLAFGASLSYIWLMGHIPRGGVTFLKRAKWPYFAFFIASTIPLIVWNDAFLRSEAGAPATVGPAFAAMLAFFTLWSIVGLFVAIRSYRTASNAMERRQASGYIAAFAARDALIFASRIAATGIFGESIAMRADTPLSPVIFTMLFGVLLSFAVLRFQVLNIEIRVKQGIGKTIVASIVAAAAFAGSEALEQLFGVDKLLPAILIAAACTLAFKPLSWFANKVTTKVFPGVEDSPTYLQHRKLEIYQSAYQSALTDGMITEKERAVLESLASSLEIDPGTRFPIGNSQVASQR